MNKNDENEVSLYKPTSMNKIESKNHEINTESKNLIKSDIDFNEFNLKDDKKEINT